MTNQKREKLDISLRENGIHSLMKGIDAFDTYRGNATEDKFILKDAIMFLHHGIELLLKDMLVSRSPYLIFTDLTDAAKKQRHADKQGIDLFFIDNPPKTASYEEVLSRVEAFLQPKELNDTTLKHLRELNRLRNQLEHYAIVVEVDTVTLVLGELRQPLIDLFENSVGGIVSQIPDHTKDRWKQLQLQAQEIRKLEQEVETLLKKFNGQQIPGELFGVEHIVVLPTFQKVTMQQRLPGLTGSVTGWIPDFTGYSPEESWIAEIKGNSHFNRTQQRVFEGMSEDSGYRLWLVFGKEIVPMTRKWAKKRGFYSTDIREFEALKQLIT